MITPSLPHSLFRTLFCILFSCDLSILHNSNLLALENVLPWIPKESATILIEGDEELWQMGVVISIIVCVYTDIHNNSELKVKNDLVS